MREKETHLPNMEAHRTYEGYYALHKKLYLDLYDDYKTIARLTEIRARRGYAPHMPEYDGGPFENLHKSAGFRQQGFVMCNKTTFDLQFSLDKCVPARL